MYVYIYIYMHNNNHNNNNNKCIYIYIYIYMETYCGIYRTKRVQIHILDTHYVVAGGSKKRRPGQCGDSLVGHCHGSPRGVLVLVISMGIFHEITMVKMGFIQDYVKVTIFSYTSISSHFRFQWLSGIDVDLRWDLYLGLL